MLYYPWYDENREILGGYATYQELYDHVKSTVAANEDEFTSSCLDDMDIDMNSRLGPVGSIHTGRSASCTFGR